MTKTATIFVLHLDRPPVPMPVLINELPFQTNYGLLNDEVRTLYGNVPALATHIINWYFDNSTLKLGGEYICRIITFDQENVNGRRPAATLRFSAKGFDVSDFATIDQSGTPVFELEGELLNLNDVARMLQNRVEYDANRIAIYLARLKLSQLGVLQDQGLRIDAGIHNPVISEYSGRFFDEELDRTYRGRR